MRLQTWANSGAGTLAIKRVQLSVIGLIEQNETSYKENNMPYIGKQLIQGEFIKLDSITTSATATFALQRAGVAFTPASAESMIVSLNGVTQAPIDAYTLSGSNIVFASALTSNDVIDYIIILGETGSLTTPADGTVTAAKLSSQLARGATPIRINTNTLATSQTIASGENGSVIGPVTINNGVTITVNGTFTAVSYTHLTLPTT